MGWEDDIGKFDFNIFRSTTTSVCVVSGRDRGISLLAMAAPCVVSTALPGPAWPGLTSSRQSTPILSDKRRILFKVKIFSLRCVWPKNRKTYLNVVWLHYWYEHFVSIPKIIMAAAGRTEAEWRSVTYYLQFGLFKVEKRMSLTSGCELDYVYHDNSEFNWDGLL